jgi:hypothetical protein
MTTINRDIIIDVLKKRLITMDEVYAFWLEGADGLGAVDEYSDLDVWLDVEDGFEDAAFEAAEDELSKLSKLDFMFNVKHGHPKIRQNYYHVEGTNEYLIIDFCIQSHSRDKSEYKYVEGDILEFPKVIFDKADIISISKEEENIDRDLITSRIKEIKGKYMQHARVIKYVERGNYPEAFIYYLKYVADPLVELERIKYTPKYYDLHFIHISNHIPDKDREQLEYFYRISSLNDIRNKTMEAKGLCEELINEVKNKYRLEQEGTIL